MARAAATTVMCAGEFCQQKDTRAG